MLLIISNISFGQKGTIVQQDSLKILIMNLKNEVSNIKLNLISHHEEFKTGVFLSIAGILSCGLGILSSSPSFLYPTPMESNNSKALFVAGGSLIFIGTIIIIDSDKFFGEKYINRKRLGSP